MISRIRIIVFILAAFTLFATPVLAVSYHSSHSVAQHNSGGTSFKVMTTSSNHFCFLTEVHMEDVDGFAEWAKCRVYESNGAWVLTATLNQNDER